MQFFLDAFSYKDQTICKDCMQSLNKGFPTKSGKFNKYDDELSDK